MQSSISYHEAGHAVMAAWLGAEVLQVTIEPDRDEGFRLDGDARVRWHHRGLSSRQLCERELMAVLAGPIAEMIHAEQRCKIDTRPEWAGDWQIAWQLAGQMLPPAIKRRELIDTVTNKLFAVMSNDSFWQTIAEVADLLEAHETIAGEEVAECVERWLRRS